MHGYLDVPADYVDADGKRLSLWLGMQRKYHAQGKLTHMRTARLEEIGMVWGREDCAIREAKTNSDDM